MDKNELDFLDRHSPEFIEMAYDYKRLERLDHPDGYGKRTGDCGDTVEIFLTVDQQDRIESVSIQVDGCLNTVATANTVAHLSEGRTVDQAWDITPEKVADYLKTLEEDHFHCAELAVGAFCLALVNYKDLKKKPWKKTYRNMH
ncbi:MAG: iron-sulfur cluster assembly scaffold protein [Proteobacteria bacterium]|nr:iron-sulfur cluster assembly scaffold protein [Pseudomonadota bacterium]